MVILYITRVIQQKLKFCLQGIVHMNFLKTSVQAEIEIRTIGATYIALIGKKAEKTRHYLRVSISPSLQHGQTKVEEPHQPWVILQLQETAHLQEIKAGKQGECEQ